MFSTVCALPSPASAEGLPPLFGWFKGSTAQSDFSCTFTSAVRFMAFADRSWSVNQDVQEISRFSCMLFLSVRGFLDYAGPNNPDVILTMQRPCTCSFMTSPRSFASSQTGSLGHDLRQ